MDLLHVSAAAAIVKQNISLKPVAVAKVYTGKCKLHPETAHEGPELD